MRSRRLITFLFIVKINLNLRLLTKYFLCFYYKKILFKSLTEVAGNCKLTNHKHENIVNSKSTICKSRCCLKTQLIANSLCFPVHLISVRIFFYKTILKSLEITTSWHSFSCCWTKSFNIIKVFARIRWVQVN